MDAKVNRELRPAPASPSRVRETAGSFEKDVADAAAAEAAADEEARAGQDGNADKEASDAAFMVLARDRAQRALTAWTRNFELYRKDVEFRSGRTQWPTKQREVVGEGEAETEQERVRLTLNQLPKFIRQVLNDGKQNRHQIRVKPIEGDAPSVKVPNQAGTKDYTLAQVTEGIARNVEQTSMAEDAYDKSLEHCVEGGFGWLKVDKRLARPDGFEQELVIRAKRNPCTVLFDPEAMLDDEPNFLAGNFAFEIVTRNRTEAELDNPEIAEASEFSEIPPEISAWWQDGETVKTARYWYVETKPCVYLLLSNGAVMTEEDFNAASAELAQQNVTEVDRRDGEKRCVYWCDIDGIKKLSEPVKWPGGFIPLVPVLGPEVIVDGEVIYESFIRHAHDAQRMSNYWHSAATETVAASAKVTWLADAASIAGFEDDYRRSIAEPIHLLKYRFREGVPAPQLVTAKNNPGPEITLAMHANDNLKNILGLYDASLGARSNETSGIAIRQRQQEGDTGTYNWHDSLAKAIQQIGVILVDMIPNVYDTQRIVRLRTPDDQEDFVQINHTFTPKGAPGEPPAQPVKADLAAQRYDVAVSTGPSVTTQREAAAAAKMEFLGIAAKVSPQHAAAVLDKVAKSMDWDNADEIADRLRKLLPPNLLSPAELELLKAELAKIPQDPQAQEQAQLEQKIADRESEAKVVSANAALITAQAKLAEAQAMAPERVKDLVAQAVAELLSPAASPPPAAPVPQ